MKHKNKFWKSVTFYVIMSAISFFILLPLFWMISTSLKETKALTTIPIQWIPEKISFKAYLDIFEIFPFARAIFNSVFLSVAGTFITVMSATMAAYVFGKIEFKGREVLFTLYLATMMIPGNVTMIPNYLVLRQFGLLNTYVGVLLPGFFSAFGTFLLRQHIKSLADGYLEAAVIDGASSIKIFFKVVMPLVRPSIATLTVLTFMGNWNSYMWPLIVMTDKSKMTLPVGLSLLNGQHGSDYNMLMAGALISILPMIIVYAFAQKYFEEGLNVGGIK